MATLTIRDDVLRARHIEGDPDLARRVRDLPPAALVVLRIEGRPIRFRKVEDEPPGDALRPEPEAAAFWQGLLARPGRTITVEAEVRSLDPYLLSLSATLTEWNSPEDAAAYDGL